MGHTCSRSNGGRRPDGGFSLAELLIVLALIGIVAVVAVPVAGKIIRHSNGLGAFASMRQALAAARLQAIKRGANVVVEVSLIPGVAPGDPQRIRLHTFQDRANDTTSPLPADELTAAGNYRQDEGSFATSPGTDEPTLADITLAPGVVLWRQSGTQNDLGAAAAFDGYAGNAALTDRVVFLPSGGIAPPESASCGLPTPSGGRGIYFADSKGKNFFRVTVESNLSGKFRVDKYVAGSGYVASGWTWL